MGLAVMQDCKEVYMIIHVQLSIGLVSTNDWQCYPACRLDIGMSVAVYHASSYMIVVSLKVSLTIMINRAFFYCIHAL